MYINGYQCDNCEKISNTGANELPKEWYKIQQLGKPNRHFCSISCLYQWSSNMLRDIENNRQYVKEEQAQ